jgi:hypothetical protein
MVLGQRTVAGTRGRRARQLLIVVEVALTVVLLAGSGLLIRSLIHLQTLPPGFDPNGVLTAQASLDQADYHDPARFTTLMQQSVAAMQRIPGVMQAAVGLSLPYERGLNSGVTVKDGKQAGQRSMTSEIYITPAYFDALGIPLRDGRAFTNGDTATSEGVAIVNESFARQIMHDPNPVGRLVEQDKINRRIVGVISDVQQKPGLDDTGPISTERTLYIPATQVPGDFLSLVHVWFQPSWIIGSSRLDAQTPAAMQRALSSVDPNLPFASFRTMDDLRAGLQRHHGSSARVRYPDRAGLTALRLDARGRPLRCSTRCDRTRDRLDAGSGCPARHAQCALRHLQLRSSHAGRDHAASTGTCRPRQPAPCAAHHPHSTRRGTAGRMIYGQPARKLGGLTG